MEPDHLSAHATGGRAVLQLSCLQGWLSGTHATMACCTTLPRWGAKPTLLSAAASEEWGPSPMLFRQGVRPALPSATESERWGHLYSALSISASSTVLPRREAGPTFLAGKEWGQLYIAFWRQHGPKEETQTSDIPMTFGENIRHRHWPDCCCYRQGHSSRHGLHRGSTGQSISMASGYSHQADVHHPHSSHSALSRAETALLHSLPSLQHLLARHSDTHPAHSHMAASRDFPASLTPGPYCVVAD